MGASFLSAQHKTVEQARNYTKRKKSAKKQGRLDAFIAKFHKKPKPTQVQKRDAPPAGPSTWQRSPKKFVQVVKQGMQERLRYKQLVPCVKSTPKALNREKFHKKRWKELNDLCTPKSENFWLSLYRSIRSWHFHSDESRVLNCDRFRMQSISKCNFSCKFYF